MKLDELSKKVKIYKESYGWYRIWIFYRERSYTCSSSNSSAYDRIMVDDDISHKKKLYGLTLCQAYKRFYDECKIHNNLM